MQLLFVAAATAAAAAAAPPTLPAVRPHILLVVADDLGYADVGFNWLPELETEETMAPITPNIDALAQAGLILDSFYTASVCGPSRTSLMSGRLPIHVNMINPFVWSSEGSLPLEMTTMASKLTSTGYRCYHVGKWHMGSATSDQLPINRGFASSLGILGGSAGYNSYSRRYGPAPSMYFSDLWEDTHPTNSSRYATDLYTDKVNSIAAKHVKEMPATPMFIHLAHQAPHGPYEAPKESVLKYVDATFWNECAGNYCTANETNKKWFRQVYLAMVTAMDDGIGSVIKTLKAEKIYDNTLVVFCSDNGGKAPKIRNKGGEYKFGPASNGWQRGGKGDYYEGGVNVAAFISGGALPEEVRGNRRSGFIHIADLYATFGALAGYNVSDPRAADAGLPPSDSMDMWPFLSGQQPASPRLEVPLQGITVDPAKLSKYFYMPAKELASYVLVANLNSTSYSNAIYKDQLQHVLLKTINGSNFKLFIEAVSSNESVTKAVYNLSADPTEQSNIVEGFAAPEEHTDAAVATVWTVLLNRVDELAPTYYQAQTSGSFEKDVRCTGAAKQCYGRHYGPFLVRGDSDPADDVDTIEYPSRCFDLRATMPSTASSNNTPTSTSTSLSTPPAAPAELEPTAAGKSTDNIEGVNSSNNRTTSGGNADTRSAAGPVVGSLIGLLLLGALVYAVKRHLLEGRGSGSALEREELANAESARNTMGMIENPPFF